MKIPSTASPEVQQAFRELWAAVERLGGAQNVDLQGRRILNAGPAVSGTDYVTLDDLRSALRTVAAGITTTTPADTSFADALALLEDAGVVFAKPGALATDVDNFSWRYSNGSLRYGADISVRWHHRAELRSPDTGVLELSGEDHDVSNAFARLVLGLDNGSGIALVRNGTTLEIRYGGPGVFSNLAASQIAGESFVVNANPGVDFGPGAPVSLTIEKGIVTAAS